MKKLNVSVVFLFAGLCVASVLVTSCGSKKTEEAEHHHHAEGDTTGHEKTQTDPTQIAYACPMHPEVTGKEGDKCSKCGMKLEPVETPDKK
jgi:hypothetical protein